MSEIQFVDGISLKSKTFADGNVLLKMGLHCEKLIDFLYTHKGDGQYVNIDIKKSKNGNWYASLDTWKPDPSKKQEQDEIIGEEEIPF